MRNIKCDDVGDDNAEVMKDFKKSLSLQFKSMLP